MRHGHAGGLRRPHRQFGVAHQVVFHRAPVPVGVIRGKEPVDADGMSGAEVVDAVLHVLHVELPDDVVAEAGARFDAFHSPAVPAVEGAEAAAVRGAHPGVAAACLGVESAYVAGHRVPDGYRASAGHVVERKDVGRRPAVAVGGIHLRLAAVAGVHYMVRPGIDHGGGDGGGIAGRDLLVAAFDLPGGGEVVIDQIGQRASVNGYAGVIPQIAGGEAQAHLLGSGFEVVVCAAGEMLVGECLVYEQVGIRDGPDGSPADPEVGVVVHLIDAVLAPDAVSVGVPPVVSGSGVVVVGEIDVAGGQRLLIAARTEHYMPACNLVVIADDEDVLDALGAAVRQEGPYLLQKIVGAVLGLDPGHVDDPGRNALGRLPVGQPLHGPNVVLMGNDHVLAVGQLVGLNDAGAGVRYRLRVDHHGAHDVHRALLALIGAAQDRAGLLGVHDVQRYR